MCFKIFLIFLIIINYLNLITFVYGKVNCMENSNHFKCRMSLAEPYRYIENLNVSEIQFPGCKAEKIWMFIRHGTRLPDPDVLRYMDKLPEIHKKIIDNCRNNTCDLSNNKFQALANWTFKKIPSEDALNLVEEGVNEAKDIAKRFQIRFPDLMPKKYDNSTYKFKVPITKKGKEGGPGFTIGLFGEQEANNFEFSEPTEEDLILLQFYQRCDKWLHEVKRSNETITEYRKFKNGEVVKAMEKNASQRLGFDANFHDLVAIYLMCTFEVGWNEEPSSPWCPLLTDKDFEILEFAEDLRNYYVDGYVYPITRQQSCPLLVDMFDFVRSESTLKTAAYFTHSKSILKFLSLLGVANEDEPLFHDSFEKAKNRLWRTSLINPFSANIAFVLYNCTSSGPSVLFMLQERIVKLPGCPENVPCPLSVMEEKYPDNKNECDFHKICSLK